MTGWRASIEAKVETTFGQVADGEWKYLGPGSSFNFSGNNNWKYVNGIGNKKPELQLEGRFNSSWSGSVYLDYNNFYWLYLCMEGYEYDSSTSEHIFTFKNDEPIRSFSLRVTRLDGPVGGTGSTQIILLGCKVNSFGATYESGSGGIKCDFGGNCVDWKMNTTSATKLPRYASSPDIDNIKTIKAVNWGCFLVSDVTGTGSTPSWTQVALNERCSWKAGRSISTVPSSCGRVDKASYESALQPVTVSSTVYSRNPNVWLSRFRNGGKQEAIDLTAVQIKERGLQPVPDVLICSHEDTTEGCNSTATGKDYVRVFFKNVGVDTWGNSYSSSSEITESPSMKAMDMTIKIHSTIVNSPIVPESSNNSQSNESS